MFSDRRVRRTYVLTKVAVVAAAAVATVPLAYVIGAKAWYGFAAFVAVMAVLTLGVLAIGSAGSAEASPEEEEQEEGSEDDDSSGQDPDEPVVLPVEDHIDLHPFSPADIPDVVADYLQAAHAAGYREVRLIHGRGIGVQRERVRSLLQRHPLVSELHDATSDRGGWGATIAHLCSTETNAVRSSNRDSPPGP